MNHDDAADLLAPLALDALDAEMRAAVEVHVATCTECQGELDALREVASALGTSVEQPPPGLWEKISERLYDDGPAALPDLGPEIVSPIALSDAPARRRRWRAVSAVSLVAAAAIVVLSLSLSSESARVSNLQSALDSGAARQALRAPGHRLVQLTGADDRVLATFVVLRDGTGYLLTSSMPTLATGETYQLWGIVADKPVSIGVMGSHPRRVAFTLATTPRPTKLAVTVEPSGGTSTPTTAVVASGEL